MERQRPAPFIPFLAIRRSGCFGGDTLGRPSQGAEKSQNKAPRKCFVRLFRVRGAMRGRNRHQQGTFLYAGLEEVASADPPLRPIRPVVDQALRRMDETWTEISDPGRFSLAPERRRRA